jgi:MFS transporter, PPP family, 3-phenylpropionic acid transporter
VLNSALNKIRARASGAPFAVRLAVFNAAVFLVIGVHVPYMPLWLSSQGLSDKEVSMVMATPQIVRIGFTPLISFFADRTGDFRAVLRLLCLGTLLALLALGVSHSFLGVFGSFFLYAVFWTTIIPLTETIAMKGVREEGHSYGRMRLWGSLSFIFASAACGGAIQLAGASAAITFITVAAFCLFAASFALPRGRSNGAEPEAPHASDFGEARAILGAPVFWVFLAAASTVQSAHGFYYTFASIHWESLHYPGVVIGALWTLGVIAEIVLFAYSGRLVIRFKPSQLILMGAAASVVRWAVMALEPPLIVLFPLQVLHAFTFGASHLGAVHFISEAIPERHSATAQGLYAAVSGGAAMGLVTLASGSLHHDYGASGYWLMALLAALSVVCALLLNRLWLRGNLAS